MKNSNRPAPGSAVDPSDAPCIAVAEELSFCAGSAVRHLWRASRRRAVEDEATRIDDLEMARWYVERELQRLRHTASTESGRRDAERARTGVARVHRHHAEFARGLEMDAPRCDLELDDADGVHRCELAPDHAGPCRRLQ